MKSDTVTITITGTKKFRQEVVNLIYETLLDEDILLSNVTVGNINIESTLEPKDEDD